MTFNRIIEAAIKDMREGKETAFCGSPSRENGIQWVERYADSNCVNSINGILLGDWNRYPKRLCAILERAGYDVEWEDEYARCSQCRNAIRISPNSYSWKALFITFDDGDFFCSDCIKEDLDRYEEHLLNHSNRADTLDIDWSKRGFTQFNKESYENGWHPGQNDDPNVIVKMLPVDHDFLFTVPFVGQFDIYFDCWIKLKE
jgi:hypothetical protein